MEIFLVQGLYFGSFANSISPLLFSKVAVYELHESNFIPNTLDTSCLEFYLFGVCNQVAAPSDAHRY